MRTSETDSRGSNLIEFNTRPNKFNEDLIKNNKSDKNDGFKAKFEDFRPSPQLNIDYEYNRFPVKPVHPEAKTVPNYNKITAEEFHNRDDGYVAEGDSNDPSLKQRQIEDSTLPWTTVRNYEKITNSWGNKVRFPPPKPPTHATPYPFEANAPTNQPNCCQGSNLVVPQYSAHSKIARPDYAVTNPRSGYFPSAASTYGATALGINDPRIYATSLGGVGRDFNFDKLIEIPKKYYPYDTNYEKTHEVPFNIMEKPYEIYHSSQGGGHGGSSWKKVLKLLATFIPIGLLISALTPTVITVTNVNDTSNMQQTRYRSNDDSKKELHKRILSSLDYFDKLNENGCEYRVFCELLVTANQMPDSEQHIQNLLDNFANQDVNYRSRAKELKQVFEAVRKRNCSSVSCNDLDNT